MVNSELYDEMYMKLARVNVESKIKMMPLNDLSFMKLAKWPCHVVFLSKF